jgi:hypothetical protein
MRQADRDEIYNVVGHNNPLLLAQQTLDAGRMGSAVVANRNERPVAVVGFVPVCPGVCTAFAFATDAFPSVALTLTRYAIKVMKPALLSAGFHRLECESRADHVDAHRWLEALGFEREGILKQRGSDRSDYIKFGATANVYAIDAQGQEAARTAQQAGRHE